MLRLQHRVQVMLTHYMLGLLSLLKCSKGKMGERTEKPEAEHKSREGMKKKNMTITYAKFLSSVAESLGRHSCGIDSLAWL